MTSFWKIVRATLRFNVRESINTNKSSKIVRFLPLCSYVAGGGIITYFILKHSAVRNVYMASQNKTVSI